MHTDISVELCEDKGQPVAFKFSCDMFELNVRVPQSLLPALEDAHLRAWKAGSIRAGSSAGAAAFWSAGEPGQISIMVGDDDETWDFAVSVPADAFALALVKAKQLVAQGSGA